MTILTAVEAVGSGITTMATVSVTPAVVGTLPKIGLVPGTLDIGQPHPAPTLPEPGLTGWRSVTPAKLSASYAGRLVYNKIL